jgi:hypothetical protein
MLVAGFKIRVVLPEFFRTDLGQDALRELMVVRAALDALEVELVATLRAQGCTWVELGEILGVTPQGAAKRHRTTGRGRADRDHGQEPFIPFAKS